MQKFGLLCCMLFIGLGAVRALAQFEPVDENAQAQGANALGQSGSFANVTTTFDGIEVKIKRLIRDPAGDDAVRLIFSVANNADKERRMLFIGPQSTLVDELGNVYFAQQTIGIDHCVSGSKWYADVNWCGRNRAPVLATRLAKGVPVTVAIRYKPGKDYSEELAKMSASVSLRARIAHYADDLSDGKSADIIVNNIPFPGN